MIAEAAGLPPEVLYKYCDPSGMDILASQRLKITPLNRFNDRFELAPRMRSDLPVEDARRIFSDPVAQRVLYEGVVSAGLFTGSFEEFEPWFQQFQDPVADKISAGYAADAKGVQQKSLAFDK